MQPDDHTSTAPEAIPGVDTSRPSIARVYDAMLGGKDNFDVDRAMLASFVEINPDTMRVIKDNRQFVRRVVRWLTGEPGIDQFLDVGSGLPTVENTHEVAQRVNPDAVVVYVDNDPSVCAHGRALLADEERSFFAAGDLAQPERVLADPAVAPHLDFDRPIALLQCATLHFIPEQADAEAVMRRYVDHLAAGSYVVITHGRQPEPDDPRAEQIADFTNRYHSGVSGSLAMRRQHEIEALFGGLPLVEPGLVPVDEWWPGGPRGEVAMNHDLLVGGVGSKPRPAAPSG